MTRMTSSSTNNKHPPSLTDFSIHSIIHGSPSRTSAQVPAAAAATDDQPKLDNTASAGQPPSNTVRKYRPKNFHCPACKMAFSNNGQLKNHVRIHTGERPFQCDLANCRKTFTRNEELTRHKLIHTGFRPHACTTCGKRFGRKDHLKKHLRTHERKKLRRRVSLVSSQHQVVALAGGTIQQPMGTCYLPEPAGPATQAYQHKQQPNVRPLSCVSVCSTRDISRLPPPLMSTSQSATLLSRHLPSTSLSAQCAPTSKASFHHKPPPFAMSSNTIQQLASDYWSKWYNILGFYHHHHQPVVVSAPPIAPMQNSSVDSLFSKHI